MIVDGLWDVYNQYHMGITAENVAKQYGITPRDAGRAGPGQPAKGCCRAGRRQVQGRNRGCEPAQKKGDPVVFNADEYLNRKTNAEALAGLRPAFDKAGHVTAGNASGINDGAAAVVVMSAKKAAALGLTPLARIASLATSGLDPATMGMGPVPASRKALQRAGWKAADVDLFELNEAFAAQACAVNKEMGIDPAKVNVNGGAIAIGHPIGASGCRILVTCCTKCSAAMPRRASPRCALAAAWGFRSRCALNAAEAVIQVYQRRLHKTWVETRSTVKQGMSQKVAYVTGGMGGIGTAICQRLHKEGFKVIAGCGPTRDHPSGWPSKRPWATPSTHRWATWATGIPPSRPSPRPRPSTAASMCW
jgi:hypothetical protein